MPGTTPKWAIPYAVGADIANTLDNTMLSQATLLDGLLSPYSAGALSSRPVSTPGSPGKPGRHYFAIDEGIVYLDTGTAWVAVGGATALRYVGAAGEPAFVNQYANLDGTTTGRRAAFRRTADGMVHLEGAVTQAGGTITQSVVFTLPVGYRPPQRRGFIVVGGQPAPGPTQIDVLANGEVYWMVGPTGETDIFVLDGISFRAA